MDILIQDGGGGESFNVFVRYSYSRGNIEGPLLVNEFNWSINFNAFGYLITTCLGEIVNPACIFNLCEN